jgi:hypothetical protein
LARPPAKPSPRYWLKGKIVATPANLFALQAAVKAGKSAFIGAMVASTMEPTGDCLQLESNNPDGLAVVHFDTEQSPYDHHCSITRALRRAGRTEPPAWLRSYCLTDVPIADRRRVLRFETERASTLCGGVHSVIVDGVGDVCVNPNDPAEAFALVDELHRLAIEFFCTVVPVLHENPGSDFGKTRGHLGSQLERKAETNLRLVKDTNGVTTAFTEKSRGAHIPKQDGVLFAFDEPTGMHLTHTPAVPTGKAATKLAAQAALADEIFRESVGGLTWTETHEKIAELEKIAFGTARKRFDALVAVGLIGLNGAERYQRTKVK